MDVSYISTKALNEGNRLSVLKLQQRLLLAQKELSSGREADVGLALGARTTETVSLRQQLASLNKTIDTNASVSARLDVAQTTLGDMSSTAQDFLNALIAARDSDTGPEVVQNQAEADLVSFTSAMNNTFAGAYLFAGENVDVKPIADYYDTSTSAGRQAVADAFLSYFGFDQNDAQVASIVPSQMQDFIDTTFAALFEEPDWSTNWSDASDTNMASRISSSEEVESSTNANKDAFRKLAKAYTMLADLGGQNMNKETFEVLANSAITTVGEAIQDLTTERAKLGTAEGHVANADTRMKAQADILTDQVNGLENVDPYEAATRVNTLTTQLQTAYSLTARVQQLTILNYL